MLRLLSALWLALAVIAGPALALDAGHGAVDDCPMMAGATMAGADTGGHEMGHARHDPAPPKPAVAMACCVAVCGAFLASELPAAAPASAAGSVTAPAATTLAGHPGEPAVPPPKPLFPTPA